MDLCNEHEVLPLFIYGNVGSARRSFMKAVVGRVFGDGVYAGQRLEGSLPTYEHLLVRNSVLLFDDFTWRFALNGNLDGPRDA